MKDLYPISAGEFLKKIVSENKTSLKLSSLIVKGRLILDFGLFEKLDSLLFSDCIFLDGLELTGSYNCQDIRFESCKFLSYFSIRKMYAKLDIYPNASIQFIRCEFDVELMIDDCKLYDVFWNECKIEKLTKITSVDARGLIFKTCKLQRLSTSQVLIASIKGAEFLGCTFDGDVVMDGLNLTILNISDCKFAESFNVGSSTISSILFLNSEVTKSVWIVDIEGLPNNELYLDGGITLQRNTFYGNVTLHGGGFRSCNLSVLRVESSRFLGGLDVEHYNVNNFELMCSPSLMGLLLFKDVKFHCVTIVGDNKGAELAFKNCLVNCVVFNGFYNYTNVIFSSCSSVPRSPLVDSLPRFAVINSNLMKVQFQNIDFSFFEEFEVENSFISEIEVSNVKWFASTSLKVDNGTAEMKRDVYRQLKKACEKHNDRINALLFQGREMEEYSKDPLLSRNDRLILVLSRTNDFGHNWWKPLLQVGLWTLLSFVVMALLASPKLSFTFAMSYGDLWLSWREVWEKMYVLPQLFNPARNLKSIFPPNADLGFWVYLLDGLQRIVLTFYIAQIVSAFRKYFK